MALGFALVYGISRLPNFAHGALYVLGGFITWSALNTLGLNYLRRGDPGPSSSPVSSAH